MSFAHFAAVAEDGQVLATLMCDPTTIFIQSIPPGSTAIACGPDVRPWTHRYDAETSQFVLKESP